MNTPRRQPEANVEVFNLGHYEQMQLAIALGWIIDPDEPPQEPDLATLRSLDRIFSHPGTLTIIKTNPED